MNNAGFIVGSYAVTVGGIAMYVVLMMRKARALGKVVPPEDRPWT